MSLNVFLIFEPAYILIPIYDKLTLIKIYYHYF